LTHVTHIMSGTVDWVEHVCVYLCVPLWQVVLAPIADGMLTNCRMHMYDMTRPSMGHTCDITQSCVW